MMKRFEFSLSISTCAATSSEAHTRVGAEDLRQADPGRALQVDPINSTLKPPGTKHLKLKCDEPLSNFAFKFNLRRHILAILAEDRGEIGRLTFADPPDGFGARYGLEDVACHISRICTVIS
jgi:hypothetical protein